MYRSRDETTKPHSPMGAQPQKRTVSSEELMAQYNISSGDDTVYRSIKAPVQRPEVQFAPVAKGKGLDAMGSLAEGFDAPPGFAIAPKPKPKPSFGVDPQLAPPSAAPKRVEVAMPLEPDSFNKDAEVPVLPPTYNIHTSVISQADRDSVLQGLSAVLSELPNTEHEVKTRNYRIRGTLFWEERMVRFMIHLFATGPKHRHQDNILIEFQRREGDSFTFQSFFRSVVERMKTRELVHFGAHHDRLPMPFQALPPLEDEEMDFSQDTTLADNLIEMCTSGYLEPQREATSVLAKGSRAARNIPLLSSPTCLATLTGMLRNCQDVQISRNAAVVLHNLFTHDSSCREEALKKTVFRDLCKSLKDWSGTDENIASSRLVCAELCGALEQLSRVDKAMLSQVAKDGGSVKSLERIIQKSSYRGITDRAKHLIGLVTA